MCACVDQKDKPSQKPKPIQVDTSIGDSDMVLGDPNAPVTIIEYADFQCPSCFDFYKVMEELNEEYIESGKVQFVFRSFPLDSHPEAESSAIACRCAGQQSRFWVMYRLLFEQEGNLGRNIYIDIANNLSLDVNSFIKCLEDSLVVQKVRSDKESYRQFGVNSTPTFIINNDMYKGVPPLEGMKSLIKEKLK